MQYVGFPASSICLLASQMLSSVWTVSGSCSSGSTYSSNKQMWRQCTYTGGVSSETLRAHTRVWCSQSTIVFYFCSLGCGLPSGPSHSKQRVLLSHVDASCLRSLFTTAMDCQSHDASLQTECAAHNLLPSRFTCRCLCLNTNCH